MKYEYKIIKDNWLEPNIANKLGREGWKLVACTSGGSYDNEYIFVRPKP